MRVKHTLHSQTLENHWQAFRKDEASLMRRVVLYNWLKVPWDLYGKKRSAVFTGHRWRWLCGALQRQCRYYIHKNYVLLLPNRKIEPSELTLGRNMGSCSLTSQGSHLLLTCSVALSKSLPGVSLQPQFSPLHTGEITWIGIPQTLGILYVYRPVKFEKKTFDYSRVVNFCPAK